MPKLRCLACAALALFWSALSPAEEILISVANYDQAWEYKLDPESGVLQLASSSTKTRDLDPTPALGDLLRQLSVRAEWRTLATTRMPASVRSAFRWALPEPGCKHFAAGRDDARVDVMHQVQVIRNVPQPPVAEIKLVGHRFVTDLGWSTDGRHLVVVEADEHYGLGLGAIFGHPVPYTTLTVAIVSAESGNIRRVPLARDVKQATVVVAGKFGDCPQQ
jgi:hypothetical protein